MEFLIECICDVQPTLYVAVTKAALEQVMVV